LEKIETLTLNGRVICHLCYDKLDKCFSCHEKILGKFVQYEDGKIVCSKCFVSSKECSICGGYMGNKSLLSGKVICNNCTANLPECYYHGGPITGVGYIVKDKNICRACLESLPKCFSCGVPIGKEFKSIGLKRFCVDCAEQIGQCSNCKSSLTGLYFAENSLNNEGVCLDCSAKKRVCCVCNSISEKNFKNLPDGRVFCENCSNTEVNQEIRAIEMALSFLTFLEKSLGIDVDPGDIDISITDMAKIELLRTNNTPPGDLAHIEVIPGGICIFLPGLPEKLFLENMVRAIVRNWLYDSFFPFSPKMLFEGFAYLIVEEYFFYKKYDNFFHIQKNIRNLYFGGYFYLKKLRKENSLKGVYNFVIENIPESENDFTKVLDNLV
jgi:hypothetical protein